MCLCNYVIIGQQWCRCSSEFRFSSHFTSFFIELCSKVGKSSGHLNHLGGSVCPEQIHSGWQISQQVHGDDDDGGGVAGEGAGGAVAGGASGAGGGAGGVGGAGGGAGGDDGDGGGVAGGGIASINLVSGDWKGKHDIWL